MWEEPEHVNPRLLGVIDSSQDLIAKEIEISPRKHYKPIFNLHYYVIRLQHAQVTWSKKPITSRQFNKTQEKKHAPNKNIL